MQPLKYLSHWLSENATSQHYLFKISDLRPLLPSLTDAAFKAIISRAVKTSLLERVSRGVYFYKKALKYDGLLLFHVAALIRANHFNYVSLETVLSEVGVISQIPINRIAIMSSGRSNVIDCGKFGTIEFIHTNQQPNDLKDQLSYDRDCGLWKANVPLAIRDMKTTRRNCDLIDWDIVNELI